MKNVHEWLSENHSWYAKWHEHPRRNQHHWAALLVISAVLVGSCFYVLNKYNYENQSLAEGNGVPMSSNKTPFNPSIGQLKNPPPPAQDHILIQFNKNASEKQIQALYAKYNLKQWREIPDIKVKVVGIPDDVTPDEIVQTLNAQESSLINFAEDDGTGFAADVPNDPGYSGQWHLADVDMSDAWTMVKGSSSVIVADIDSGADWTHPDLAANLVAGKNFLDGSTNTQDDQGHGTAVAGTLDAVTNNANGISGVSWNVKLMPLLVLDPTDYCSWSNVASAITYAADHGAKVINISLIGLGSDSATMQSATNYAWSKGVVLFASSGNWGTSDPVWPADENNMVAVGAVNDSSNVLASFSSYGSSIKLVAPGNNINTLVAGGGYGSWYGTSFSSPIAAGIAALMLSENPSLTNTQILNLMYQSATDLGAPGWDQYYGYGLVNAYKSVMAAAQTQTTKDTTPPTMPTNLTGSAVSTSSINLSWTASSDNVGVGGYQVYRNNSLVANVSGTSYTDSGLAAGTTYSYSVVAYDTSNNVSAPSNAVTVTTLSQPANPTLSITSFQVSSKTATSATIKWSTNISSTGTVYYGTSASSLGLSASDGLNSTSHTVTISGLSKFTTYYYYVAAQDPTTGNTAKTTTSSFKTAKR